MGIQLWAFMAFVWVTMGLLGGVLEEAVVTTAEQTALSQVIQLKVFTLRDFDVLFFDFKAPVINTQFFGSLATLLTWNFTYLYGDMNIVRWLIWIPLTAATSVVAVVQVGPVILNAIATARGLLRL